uniref:Uncharacterized protein n=1 Tax=Chromera velia CCMP2878 TaxID=1169474 RepID=A0A0G4H973_9ALVE|eukprot:Cvel_25322.t1-p1 / transcript=Cvel_25322.t1 / gene=Cvel_25322 / organism=Chromera_velia_CCMP2878 / gene_product=hypothetical protein / transcript_product=hypothetical protein / location=Cvel_scaffold2853:675-4574(+) / protein_length=751 / sequence_SO=supercontig / SO=protein_coding / is_pseudo=false
MGCASSAAHRVMVDPPTIEEEDLVHACASSQLGKGDEVASTLYSGIYRRVYVQNGWHQGKIQRDEGDTSKLQWVNQAGVKWSLTIDEGNNRLCTSTDCTYNRSGTDDTKHFELFKTDEEEGFIFQGDKMIRVKAFEWTQIPGVYQREPAENGWHTVEVHQWGEFEFEWVTSAGPRWTLALDWEGGENNFFKVAEKDKDQHEGEHFRIEADGKGGASALIRRGERYMWQDDLPDIKDSPAGRFFKGKLPPTRKVMLAVNTFKTAFDTLVEGRGTPGGPDYASILQTLEKYWSTVGPAGTRESYGYYSANGVHLGIPVCYYALRMMTDTCRLQVEGLPPIPSGVSHDGGPRKLKLGIVVVREIKGIMPATEDERDAKKGTPVTRTAHPAVLPSGDGDLPLVFAESLPVFQEYLKAVSDGTIELVPEVVVVDGSFEGVVRKGNGCGMKNAGLVVNQLPKKFRQANDFTWVLYPDFRPNWENKSGKEWVTGGMGINWNGGPMFISDDLWVVKKPSHLGQGEWTSLERQAYIPQWLQHELMHHLQLRTYKEFGLEGEKNHEWFNRSWWEKFPDFEGRNEPDFYHEGMFKRIRKAEGDLMWQRLTYGVSPLTATGLQNLIEEGAVAGYYEAYIDCKIQNDWHRVTLETVSSSEMKWKNKAGVVWKITVGQSEDGEAELTCHSSYGTQIITLKLDDTQRKVTGMLFKNEFYKKVRAGRKGRDEQGERASSENREGREGGQEAGGWGRRGRRGRRPGGA